MQYTHTYKSPLGKILLATDDEGLTGLWFEGQKYFANNLDAEHEEKLTPVLEHVSLWLDEYFTGKNPNFTHSLHMLGTNFQVRVWQALLEIPYGHTITYGELAQKLSTSPRAIGGAVAHNNISIIVPCHRVVGANGDLTGYAGGIDRKQKLLALEKAL